MKRILSKADIVLFVIIAVIAVTGIVLLSGGDGAGTAVIRVNGEVEREVSLSIDQSFYIGNVQIEVKDGAIAFIESDCPTKQCVKTGWLKTPGASAACLPNRISITVVGEREVDAVAK